ncbi:MAG: acyl carrier protein [Deltaproteobacteria bacterium]|nr:acyl carrier protein [Deltaproteobacteria bacterium]
MGSTASVEERIITGLAKVLNKQPSQIQMESRLIEDLEVDSLDALDLIFKLEEEFDIEIPQGQLPFVTVQDVIDYVQEKIKGA